MSPVAFPLRLQRRAAGHEILVDLAAQSLQFLRFFGRQFVLPAKFPEPVGPLHRQLIGRLVDTHERPQDFVRSPADDVVLVGGGGDHALSIAFQHVHLAFFQAGDDEGRVSSSENLQAGEVLEQGRV